MARISNINCNISETQIDVDAYIAKSQHLKFDDGIIKS